MNKTGLDSKSSFAAVWFLVSHFEAHFDQVYIADLIEGDGLYIVAILTKSKGILLIERSEIFLYWAWYYLLSRHLNHLDRLVAIFKTDFEGLI